MNAIQLKTFCTVARTLSFTAASGELMISQPAVSKQIAAMEEEIGAVLFYRGHNTLTLTPAGKLLYEQLPEKMKELDSLFFSAHLMNDGKYKRIKIGILRDQRMHEALLRTARGMRTESYYVNIQHYDFKGIERALEKQSIDVAVALNWSDTAFAGCESITIDREKLYLAVNRQYSPKVPDEINRETLAEFSGKCPTMIPEPDSFNRSELGGVAVHTAQFWPNVMEENIDMVLPMVQVGIGSALINENHMLTREPEVELYPLDFLEPVELRAFWPAGRKSEPVTDFLAKIKENIDYEA